MLRRNRTAPTLCYILYDQTCRSLILRDMNIFNDNVYLKIELIRRKYTNDYLYSDILIYFNLDVILEKVY